MNRELKKAICDKFFGDNYGLKNRCDKTLTDFDAYIFDKDGNFLIGGETVKEFIEDLEEIEFKTEFKNL